MNRRDFLQAAQDGDVEKVRRWLEEGLDVNTKDYYGDTGLYEACKKDHDKVVALLIKNGADLNVTNKDGFTGLYVACRGGYDKVVELLIKNGADLNVINENGDTGLHLACYNGHDKAVEMLIKNGADVNVTDNLGSTGLHLACYRGDDKVVELLIKNGADVNMTDKNEYTGLHRACGEGHDKVVELLIKNGADVNVTNRYGFTGLHVACREGHDKVVELLIKNGAGLNVTNKDGNTCLHLACKRGHDKVVELLIKNRADLNVTNKINKRPVDVAAGLGSDTQLLLETETRKQAEYSELVSSVGSEEGTTVKLFLCGDGQTGFIVGALWNIRRKFRRQDVFNPTPGVHVSIEVVPGIGRLSLHDFAGQAQFYVTHAMLLRTTNAIFPVVYKITDGEDEQKQQVHGWLSFIHCSNADPTNKPRIVLIASHADKLQDRKAGRRQAKALVEYYRKLFQESLIVSQEVFLINCLEAGSPEIQRLREVLGTFKDDMLKQRTQIPKVCVQLSKTIEGWREERKTFPVMGWQDYLAAVRQACIYIEERIAELASSGKQGDEVEVGLKAPCGLTESLRVCYNFPIVKIARTAEDYVTLEELTRVFSAVADIPLLIKLLQDFQLCHTYDEVTLIIPSLLQQEMEEAAWSPVSSKAVYFGLQIRGRTEIDSFSCDLFPRLQTLLMQAHPDKLSRPLLWKNSAKCTDKKADALLQITQDKRQLNIFVRSNDGNREDCNSIMDLLKDMTYRLLHETSPGARSRDMVLSALDLREHSREPHAYSRAEVEAAAAKGENLVHPERNVPEKVKDLRLKLGYMEGYMSKCFGKVIRGTSADWDNLAWELNFEENEIRVIREMEHDCDRRCREMLERWRNREGEAANVQALKKALIKIGHRLTAETLEARELLDILEAKGERACVKFYAVLKLCDKFAASLIVEEEMSEEGATAS
ncbi:death-associated protein kinase dapk-1-like [Branchiostoma floridae]|uniref:Death-associated protein kinase dapk-1-like n=1 Tax=Branchiostoma floridae TaxID=7739 RepID=A0A9J7HVE8_BRAFL|nr:death-associated protein kinase dapk-1-like [Branchiostoma floridae]